MSTPRPVYTIPAGQPFADRLAAGILAETGNDPLQLADIRVFLPTRRACRVLRESFLRLTEGQPLLLPRMQPIGDVQDDEPAMLESAAAAFTAIPPAMPPLRRQLLLARAIMAAPDLAAPQPEQAMVLAAALGRLLDQMHTEGKDITALQSLVPGDEIHWQVTVKFLKILSEVWPILLAAEGMIDAADRRNRLMRALAESWRTHPPQGRIIAAGTTGSIPATAELLSVIASLPYGAVVLPGLDQGMDDESWDTLDDNHPQATLRQLLGFLSLKRGDVQLWGTDAGDLQAPRRWLATELMRPAATSDRWQALEPGPALRAALADDLSNAIDLYECPTAQDEARLIATVIRHTIETPRRTVAVITPDRRLARRIAMVCRRWDIAVDDSGGQSLSASPVGTFMRLALRAAAEQCRPAALLALLRHPLCCMKMDDLPAVTALLERRALRGAKPPPGIEGLRNRVAQERAKGRVLSRDVDILLHNLEAALAPLMELLRPGADPRPLSDFAAAHAAACEALASTPEAPGSARLWMGDDGFAAANLIAELMQHGTLMALNGVQYTQMQETLSAAASVRSPSGLHPRIFILGQLEARLVQADVTILAGLNEGSWPPDPGHDPWLSRGMRRQAGLPAPERSIGLSAHDFVQGFCAPRVIMTRARRVDGAQGVPARWLQRLDTVLRAAQIDPHLMLQRNSALPPYDSLARGMDINSAIQPHERPAPAPPVALRPRSLSVTEIETWLRDPYSIYAKHVLRLRKLEELEKEPDAADRGTLLHDALSDFVASNRNSLPPDAARQLYDRGLHAIAARADDPGFWEFWLPRYGALCTWFAAHEDNWRKDGNRPEALESKGSMTVPGPAGDFVLRVRADRIDRTADGGYAVIDYKSGGADKYTPAKILSGHWPQLPLTGLILRQGGVEGLKPGHTSYMGYWVLTGGSPPGTTKSLSDDTTAALQNAAEGLEALIAAFDDPANAYHALPRPDHLPSFNDYDHLARVQEWTALGDNDNAEDAA